MGCQGHLADLGAEAGGLRLGGLKLAVISVAMEILAEPTDPQKWRVSLLRLPLWKIRRAWPMLYPYEVMKIFFHGVWSL